VAMPVRCLHSRVIVILICLQELALFIAYSCCVLASCKLATSFMEKFCTIDCYLVWLVML